MAHKARYGGQVLSNEVKFLEVVQGLDGQVSQQRAYDMLNLFGALGEVKQHLGQAMQQMRQGCGPLVLQVGWGVGQFHGVAP
jgi:hypothetical protein